MGDWLPSLHPVLGAKAGIGPGWAGPWALPRTVGTRWVPQEPYLPSAHRLTGWSRSPGACFPSAKGKPQLLPHLLGNMGRLSWVNCEVPGQEGGCTLWEAGLLSEVVAEQLCSRWASHYRVSLGPRPAEAMLS